MAEAMAAVAMAAEMKKRPRGWRRWGRQRRRSWRREAAMVGVTAAAMVEARAAAAMKKAAAKAAGARGEAMAAAATAAAMVPMRREARGEGQNSDGAHIGAGLSDGADTR